MDSILEQAKQYFVAKQYETSYKIFKDHQKEISSSNLPLAYDLAACSLFMIKKYQEARIAISRAITLNPNMGDFYINLGAILRCLSIEQQAIQVLHKASSMIINPAINYNFRKLARNQVQITAQTQLISQHEQINKFYDRYDGLVPSFLKCQSSRTDRILDKEQQLIKIICSPLLQSWDQHLMKIQQMIDFRAVQKKNYGVHYTTLGNLLFPIVKQIIDWHKIIKKKIMLTIEQKQPQQRLLKLFTKIKQNHNSAKQLFQAQYPDIKELILIKTKKQINVYKNYLNFEQAKKQLEPITERIFRVSNSVNPDIQMFITQTHCIMYVNLDFIRSINPTKTIKNIRELSEQKGSILFHLYWFVFLRVILCSEQGIDLDLFLRLKQGLHFLYYQVDLPQTQKYHLPQQQLILKQIYIIQKYNKIHKQKFLPDQKLRNIYLNCEKFKNHLSQIDPTFSKALDSQIYINILTQLQRQDSLTFNQQKQFRQTFELNPNKFQDQICENLLLIFYHFRNNYKQHQLLEKSFIDLAIQTQQMMNGKNSFFKNYYDHAHPPKNIIEKIFKKIIS